MVCVAQVMVTGALIFKGFLPNQNSSLEKCFVVRGVFVIALIMWPLFMKDGSASVSPMDSPCEAFRVDFPNILMERTRVFLNNGRTVISCPAFICPEVISPTMIFSPVIVYTSWMGSLNGKV